jgi:putative ABC transport system permease protein
VSGLRLPLRLARREVWRRPGRTALVALLVAVPVAGMVAAITLVRTDQVSPAEEWRRYNGGATARAFVAEHLDLLPTGARVVPVRQAYVTVRTTDGRRGELALTDLGPAQMFGAEITTVLEGRAPTAPGEVALATDTIERLEVAVGDRLELDRPVATTLTVVGRVEEPLCLSCATAVASTETLQQLVGQDVLVDRYLIDLPALSEAEQRALYDASGGTVVTRELSISGDVEPSGIDSSAQGVRWSLVLGAVTLTVMGIVIAAAFAVGARRQLVTIGQLTSSGASPRTVKAALVLQGTVTGVAGAVLGAALAAALLVALQGRIEPVLDKRIDGFELRPFELALALAVGVGAATLAALIPARTAAQIPTLAALAGRRPLAPVPRRLVAWGLVSIVGGLGLLALAVLGSRDGSSGQVWALVAIGGGVAELLGACAVAPALVERLEPLAARLHGSWRMAARGLARNRTRTGAVVAAVSAAAALAIAASALIQGAEAQQPDHLDTAPDLVTALRAVDQQVTLPADQGGGTDHFQVLQPPSPEEAARIERVLPGAEAELVRQAVVPGRVGSTFWDVQVGLASGSDTAGGMGNAGGGTIGMGPGEVGVSYASYSGVIVADEAVLDAAGVSAADRRELEEVGAAHLVADGGGREWPVALQSTSGGGPELSFSSLAVEAEHNLGWTVPGLLVTEATAAELGLDLRPMATLYRTPEPLTQDQRDDLSDLSALEGYGPSGLPNRLDLSFHYPESGPTPFQVELILTGVALVFSLFVVGASLALAAAESKDERDVLTVAGAPPRLLARAAGARAWLLAGIGGLLAIPIGFLPVVVFTSTFGEDVEPYPLVFPLRTVLVLVVVVPTVVAVVARTTSALAQRLRPVRISVATFD